MTNKLLFPNKYKLVGWLILIPATILGVILLGSHDPIFVYTAKVFVIFGDELFGESQTLGFFKTNITPTVVAVLFIIGAMLVGFSKEKREDEFIAKLRVSSLLWAVWVHYILLLFAFLLVYGNAFLRFMIYNMFTVLIIFIARFHYILYRNSKRVTE